MPTRKDHVPAPGKASGLRGTALCGREATYHTGDHALILRLAESSVADGDHGHLCARCVIAVRDQMAHAAVATLEAMRSTS